MCQNNVRPPVLSKCCYEKEKPKTRLFGTQEYEYRENEVHEMNIAKMKFIKMKIEIMKFGKKNLQK